MRALCNIRVVSTVLTIFILAGCNLQPTYQRPDILLSDSFPEGSVYDRQLDHVGLSNQMRSASGRAASEIGWREFFLDSRLQALIDLALKNNRDLRVAVLNVEATRAQYLGSRSTLLPGIFANATQTRERGEALSPVLQNTVESSYFVGANVAWELDIFGRIRNLRDSSFAQYLAQAETRKAAEMMLVSQVAIQYLALLGDEDRLRVTQAALASTRELHRITALSFSNGTATELDVQQSQGILEQTTAHFEAYSRARAQSESALALLVGESMPKGLPQSRPLTQQNLLADIPAGLPSDLIQRRPDIIAAEHRLRAANANIGAARAAFFPNISLTGSAGFLSASAGDLFLGSQRSWSFTPQITLPIFSGGANRANLSLAETMKNIEVANYEKTIQAAFREVSDGLAARGTYDYQIRALDAYSQTQARRLELADIRYRNGLDDYFSVLQAQRDHFSSQQSLISANLERATNLVTLYKSLGGGWTQSPDGVFRRPSGV